MVAPNSQLVFNCRDVQPPVDGECPDCEPILPGDANPTQEALCASDTGDDCVVTCPGDYSFDPTFYAQACANYYSGTFRFGLNATRFGAVDAPPYFTTVPSLWVPPTGIVMLNSSCPARLSRFLQFDYSASHFGATVVYEGIRPSTFHSDVVLDWNTTGAHGQRCVATPEGTSPVTCGGYLDCRFIFNGSGSGYYSQVSAFYLADNRTPISGIAMLTDDGSNPVITGYGLLVNRVTGTLDTVQWSGTVPEVFSILHSEAYTPVNMDWINMRLWQECPCPTNSPTGTDRPAYPHGGYVWTSVVPHVGSTAHIFNTTKPSHPSNWDGSLPRSEWQQLEYGCLLTLEVDNGFCDNEVIYRDPAVSFFGSIVTCSS